MEKNGSPKGAKMGRTVVAACIHRGSKHVENPVETVDNSCRNGRGIPYYVSLLRGEKRDHS